MNLFVAGVIGSPSMNIVAARLERADGLVAAAAFAGYSLPIPDAVVRAGPEIDGYLGRQVILGVRPSDFEDPAFADASWPRIPVAADVTEKLGSEIHVLFTVDAPPVEHKDAVDLAVDATDGEEEGAIPLPAGKSLWTARVNERSDISPGDRLEFA